MPWYKSGTVSVVQNSNAVIGVGTAFIANSRVGDAFRGPDGGWYEVTNIASDTAMSIAPNYQGATNSAGTYALAAMQGYVKDSADALRTLVNQFGGVLAVLGNTATTAGVRAALNLTSADGLPDGATNKYLTNARVLASVLTGLDVSVTGAVVATDGILAALGKLQATKADLSGSNKAVSIAQGGTGAVTAVAARAALGASGGKNLLINASYSINQRGYVSGTATTAANQYTFDRWRVVTSGQSVVFAASGTGNQITAPAGGVEQVIEGINIEAGVHTLSWGGTATATVNGTPIASGAQTSALAAGASVTVRFTGGTVKECQLEFGSVATGFEKRLRAAELSLCAWYFERITWPAAYEKIAIGQCTNTFVVAGMGYFQHPKRAAPTITPGPSNTYSVQTANGGGDTAANVSFNPSSQNTFNWAATSSSASLITGNVTALVGKASGGNYIDVSAEI
ncbi:MULTISPECIES: hypothetical protein [unclassified Pseudomonas]|uniref:hypothetical protein n=1 Tax=unclassified Pseudomonas TaxID=196821 RepID=UPI001EEFFAA4|nr:MULTISPECIES: hypothetical protein [unclassified Pseudomonas]